MILLTTLKGTTLSVSNICKILPDESKRSADFRFKLELGNAKVEDRLNVINKNSIYKFEKISDQEFRAEDNQGNPQSLYIVENADFYFRH